MPAWPNPFLVNNGTWCSGCFPDGPPPPGGNGLRWLEKVRRGCNECAGAGRIGYTPEAILANMLAEDRAAPPSMMSRT